MTIQGEKPYSEKTLYMVVEDLTPQQEQKLLPVVVNINYLEHRHLKDTNHIGKKLAVVGVNDTLQEELSVLRVVDAEGIHVVPKLSLKVNP